MTLAFAKSPSNGPFTDKGFPACPTEGVEKSFAARATFPFGATGTSVRLTILPSLFFNTTGTLETPSGMDHFLQRLIEWLSCLCSRPAQGGVESLSRVCDGGGCFATSTTYPLSSSIAAG